MVVDAGCHSPGLGEYRYLGGGRFVNRPYGGIVAVCHSSGRVVFVTGVTGRRGVGPYGGGRCRVTFTRPGGFRYLGGGRFVNRPYGVIVAASVFS